MGEKNVLAIKDFEKLDVHVGENIKIDPYLILFIKINFEGS